MISDIFSSYKLYLSLHHAAMLSRNLIERIIGTDENHAAGVNGPFNLGFPQPPDHGDSIVSFIKNIGLPPLTSDRMCLRVHLRCFISPKTITHHLLGYNSNVCFVIIDLAVYSVYTTDVQTDGLRITSPVHQVVSVG